MGNLLGNAGTPLMWFSMVHLVLINALIGVFEAWLIRRIFGGTRKTAALFLIAANYVSAFLPLVLFGYFARDARDWFDRAITIENALFVHFVGLAAILIVTLLLEFPFVYAAMNQPRDMWHTCKANFVAQAVSFALLFVPYFLLSPFMLRPIGPVRVVPLADFQMQQEWWVYHVPLGERSVWRVRVDGTGCEKVADIAESGEIHSIIARQESPGAAWQLCRRDWRKDGASEVVIAAFATELPFHFAHREAGLLRDRRTETRNSGWLFEYPRELPRELGYPIWVSDYRTDESDADAIGVKSGWWAWEGIELHRATDDRPRWYAIETPLQQSWAARYVTILPDETIVYQLGRQIVLLDPHGDRIALLALGEFPIVVADAQLLPRTETASAPK
ncbi:MAG: hypothetical protein ACKVS9_07520 [Phycisphaerae bacterium]